MANQHSGAATHMHVSSHNKTTNPMRMHAKHIPHHAQASSLYALFFCDLYGLLFSSHWSMMSCGSVPVTSTAYMPGTQLSIRCQRATQLPLGSIREITPSKWLEVHWCDGKSDKIKKQSISLVGKESAQIINLFRSTYQIDHTFTSIQAKKIAILTAILKELTKWMQDFKSSGHD